MFFETEFDSIYKTGLSNSLDGERFKPARKNAKKETAKTSNELCSHTGNEDNKLYPLNSDDTCEVCGATYFKINFF